MKISTLKKILEKIPDDYKFIIEDADTGWMIKPEGISVIDEYKCAYPEYDYRGEEFEISSYCLRINTFTGDEDDHTTN